MGKCASLSQNCLTNWNGIHNQEILESSILTASSFSAVIFPYSIHILHLARGEYIWFLVNIFALPVFARLIMSFWKPNDKTV